MQLQVKHILETKGAWSCVPGDNSFFDDLVEMLAKEKALYDRGLYQEDASELDQNIFLWYNRYVNAVRLIMELTPLRRYVYAITRAVRAVLPAGASRSAAGPSRRERMKQAFLESRRNIPDEIDREPPSQVSRCTSTIPL